MRKVGEVVSEADYEIAEPRASSMLEALRAVGYSVQTALADLIDNSITAGARNVWLTFHWGGEDSHITLRDDGRGMSEAELADAMRPGNRSPLDERAPNDLGRFGLGLKTASFSQARRLTVASLKAGGRWAIRRWDLDYVRDSREWRLLKTEAPGSASRLSTLDGQRQGTLVLWEQMDRIVGKVRKDDAQAQSRFLALARTVGRHLGMVFHRYLEVEDGRPPLRIYLNGSDADSLVRPWDPFLYSHVATYQFPEEALKLRKEQVQVTGYVLPHKDRMREDEYEAAAGPGGWNTQQGFYVYRERRLLVAGGWLSLGYATEEHYRLARLKVDISNSTDAEWEIDVKKSRARPPTELEERLRELADAVRKLAREVFVHRGARGRTSGVHEIDDAWESVTTRGRFGYRVRRAHPLVKFVIERQGSDQKPLKALLRLLEETVPVQRIWLDASEKPEAHAEAFESEPPARVAEVLGELFKALRADGETEESARERILSMRSFAQYAKAINELGSKKR
ncbi:ATP-binding protein [Myxococcus xanthus]|uniref:ATP-binding protein n=1 Tax=Myxococcus xanthus TaxID=34 RepID=A0AAE6G0S7_MYXXA|nr:ATP-binding protein [Myxococcus xanthus]QDE68672.1 ATP-binding protein [Myxococcus xanthus]QDE75948.1 ATP-binding protein [Myxococcus xanthus]